MEEEDGKEVQVGVGVAGQGEHGALTMRAVETGDSGAGSLSVDVFGVQWVSLVICVGQAGVCTVIYPLLGLGPGGHVLIRLG